jgi:microcystin-dependent protein
MSEPFIGEIRMFAGNFAPVGWALCDGQLLAISENEALFTLIGTIYGGDGQITFGLPDLRGRIPIHRGAGPGLSSRTVGERGGTEDITLTINQMPSHAHAMFATDDLAGRGDPSASLRARGEFPAYTDPSALVRMQSDTIANVGSSQPHVNVQPFLCVHFIIALFGIFPSRS